MRKIIIGLLSLFSTAKCFAAGVQINGNQINPASTINISSIAITGAGTVAHGVLIGEGSSVVVTKPAMGNGGLVIGAGTSVDPSTGTIAGTANQVIVTNGVGTITLSLPQNIGTGSSPTFAGLTLTSPLTVANGGTSTNTFTAHALLVGEGTSAINPLATMPNGSLAIGAGTSSDPSIATLTGTSNQVVVTNGAGSITLSLPQSIGTGNSPTFTGLTISGSSFSVGTSTLVVSGGNVGINNSSPITTLQIGAGSTNINAANVLISGNNQELSVNDDAHNLDALIFADVNGAHYGSSTGLIPVTLAPAGTVGGGVYISSIPLTGIHTSSPQAILDIQQGAINSAYPTLAVNSSVLTVFNSNKVGINTASPATTLDVNGTSTFRNTATNIGNAVVFQNTFGGNTYPWQILGGNWTGYDLAITTGTPNNGTNRVIEMLNGGNSTTLLLNVLTGNATGAVVINGTSVSNAGDIFSVQGGSATIAGQLHLGNGLTTNACGAGVTTCTATCPANTQATGCGNCGVAAVAGLSVDTGGSATGTSCTCTALTATTITAYVYCSRLNN